MNARIDKLFAEVRQLSTEEQEELLARLDMALDDDVRDSGDIDPDTFATILRRVDEAERGEAEFVSHEEGMAELRRLARE